MEGTRLTIVKVPHQPDAYEFSIRTPVTPPRWKDFEQVLAAPSLPACVLYKLLHLTSCTISVQLSELEPRHGEYP